MAKRLKPRDVLASEIDAHVTDEPLSDPSDYAYSQADRAIAELAMAGFTIVAADALQRAQARIVELEEELDAQKSVVKMLETETVEIIKGQSAALAKARNDALEEAAKIADDPEAVEQARSSFEPGLGAMEILTRREISAAIRERKTR